MTLKLISVRIPESMHTYIKVKAAAEGKTSKKSPMKPLAFSKRTIPAINSSYTSL